MTNLILHSKADELESWDERKLTVFVSTDDGPKQLDGLIFKEAIRVDSRHVHLTLAYDPPPPTVLDEIKGRHTVSVVYGKKYNAKKVVIRAYHCIPIMSRLSTSPLNVSMTLEGMLKDSDG